MNSFLFFFLVSFFSSFVDFNEIFKEKNFEDICKAFYENIMAYKCTVLDMLVNCQISFH